jgi:hypothetical protein
VPLTVPASSRAPRRTRGQAEQVVLDHDLKRRAAAEVGIAGAEPCHVAPLAPSTPLTIRRLSTIRTQSTKFDSRWRCRLPVGPWRSHADCDRHYPADQGRVLAVDRAFLSKGCARCSIISALRRCQPGPFARFACEPATVLSGSITLIASCWTTLCRLPRRAPSLVATTTPRG